MIGRFRRAREVNAIIHGWTMQYTPTRSSSGAQVRVPAAVVGNGHLLPTFEQLVERDVFVMQPEARASSGRAPFRFSGMADRVMTPAPRTRRAQRRSRSRRHLAARRGATVGERPLAGVTVLDFTAFWSGPFATAWLPRWAPT